MAYFLCPSAKNFFDKILFFSVILLFGWEPKQLAHNFQRTIHKTKHDLFMYIACHGLLSRFDEKESYGQKNQI